MAFINARQPGTERKLKTERLNMAPNLVLTNSFLPLRDTLVQPPFLSASARSAPVLVRRVLLLDDDQLTRRLDALLLARVGYSVDTAEDGELGWDALCTAHYDLLVTDHDMPRLTGLQLVERLRSAGLTLPVIIASGSAQLGEAEDYPWLGLAAILHKPFPLANLISAIRRALPIAPDAGEGAIHCLGLPRDASIHCPFPSPPDGGPEVFAETA